MTRQFIGKTDIYRLEVEVKNVGIHVLDFNDNIIDFISQSDGALINAEMSMNVEEKQKLLILQLKILEQRN